MWSSWWVRPAAESQRGLTWHLRCPFRFFAGRPSPSEGWKQRWTPEEDEQILRLRQDGKTTDEMVRYLHGRSLAAIESRLYGALRQTLKDRGLIKRYQSDLSASDVTYMRNARAQGVPWMEILKNYPGRSLRAVNRTLNAIESGDGATERRKQPFEHWEDELLLKCRDDELMNWPEIFAQLPDRSPGSIWKRYRGLVRVKDRSKIPGKKFYTKTEVRKLIRLRDKGLTWDQIAKQLGKTATFGLRTRYMKEKYFGNTMPKTGTWTKKEDQQLRKLYKRGSIEWIENAVRKLNRAPQAINVRAWHLRTQDARAASALASNDSRPHKPA